jgi:hypothetical protein
MVIGPSEVAKKQYDILLVDEAHRLSRRRNIISYGSFDNTNRKLGFDKHEGTQLDWILKQSEYQIFFYDPAQSVKPSDIEKARFDAIKQHAFSLDLHSQMRVKGGVDYISFVDKLLKCDLEASSTPFEPENYELKLFESIHDLYEQLQIKESEMGLCRFIAGYSWEWKSQKDQSIDDIVNVSFG